MQILKENKNEKSRSKRNVEKVRANCKKVSEKKQKKEEVRSFGLKLAG
jgi:hypothetical protein